MFFHIIIMIAGDSYRGLNFFQRVYFLHLFFVYFIYLAHRFLFQSKIAFDFSQIYNFTIISQFV